MDTNDSLIMVFARNSFYKRLHYLALGAFFLSLFVIAFLIAVLIYLLRDPAHPIYFATDNVTHLIQVVPVNMPNMSEEEVTAWTVDAVEAAFSYDYINFRAQLQDAEKYFTDVGWKTYMKALVSSNNLLALTVRKQIILAQVIGQPEIKIRGFIRGSKAWQYEMNLLVTYYEAPYDDKSKFSNALVLSVIVQREPVLQGYKGLGISQLIASFATASNVIPEMSGTSTG